MPSEALAKEGFVLMDEMTKGLFVPDRKIGKRSVLSF
jgi:hypothetical protein